MLYSGHWEYYWTYTFGGKGVDAFKAIFAKGTNPPPPPADQAPPEEGKI
jgi:hypothetical protein